MRRLREDRCGQGLLIGNWWVGGVDVVDVRDGHGGIQKCCGLREFLAQGVAEHTRSREISAILQFEGAEL